MTNLKKNTHAPISKRSGTLSKLTSRQIDKLKLLGTHPLFQELISDFRKRYNIDVRTRTMSTTGSGESIENVVKRMSNDLEEIGRGFQLFGMMYQFYRYARYDIWEFDPAFPKKFMGKSLTVPRSYEIVHKFRSVDTEGDEISGRVIEQPASVSLVTYARLTTGERGEERAALKELKQAQKMYLNPTATAQTRRKRNLDRDLLTDHEMSKRERRHKEEVATSEYVAMMKARLEKGDMTEAEFRQIKKDNPHGIKIISKGKTSRDIAIKKLGAAKRANLARQIAYRMERKRQELL